MQTEYILEKNPTKDNSNKQHVAHRWKQVLLEKNSSCREKSPVSVRQLTAA